MPVVPGADFRAVYTAFDGFEVMDQPSYVRLWSCDEIRASSLRDFVAAIATGRFDV